MNIIETKFFWSGSLQKRAKTDYIILHHRAGNGDVQSIHDYHINGKKWVGIGYHFYIRKDGSIYRGRPINTIGAHTENMNFVSVGVCFEGNYHDIDKVMPTEQLKAGQELIAYLKGIYPDAEVKGHRDFQATGCPGQYFPFEGIKRGENKMDIETAKKILKEKAGLDDSTIQYLMFYKYGKELVIKLAEKMGT